MVRESTQFFGRPSAVVVELWFPVDLGYASDSIYFPMPSCDHLLLMVDLTFWHAEGGLLYDAFNALWSKIIETADDPDFDEREPLDDLLQEVDSLADSELSSSHDGMPGMSSSYNCYYCGSKKKSLAALKSFISNE